MKKILYIILITLVPNLYGQQKQPSTKEVMRSGKYYYYKDYAKDEAKAKAKAKNGLMSLITEELSKSSDINNVEKVTVQNIRYLVKHLTGEVKVLAYVHKDSLQFDKKGEMSVVRVETKEETPTEIAEKTKETEQNPPQEIQVEKNQSPESREDVQASVALKQEKFKLNDKSNVLKDAKDIFTQFLQCDNLTEVDRLMRRLKSQNKINGSLVSRKYRERHNPTDYNRIIIDFRTQKVKAVYKKGSNENQKTNASGQPDRRDLQVWFQIL